MVILTIVGAFPQLVCALGLAFTLLRAKPPQPGPAAQIAPAANVQLIPAQNVQMVPATNVQMVPAQPAPNMVVQQGTIVPPAEQEAGLAPAKVVM